MLSAFLIFHAVSRCIISGREEIVPLHCTRMRILLHQLTQRELEYASSIIIPKEKKSGWDVPKREKKSPGCQPPRGVGCSVFYSILQSAVRLIGNATITRPPATNSSTPFSACAALLPLWKTSHLHRNLPSNPHQPVTPSPS